ncbi:tetratricopeptide repeat protein [Sphingomonas sp.]|uniref:tetratricopeptide repeat protein n=1 Tax=Sphingomonas sp. TaxID=28214 RepID=UPI00286B0D80|nr:tetratricopeptide repeat protein [Sphingomonas sp.]
MALTPDTGETFLREVDENLRRDQLRAMARKYAPLWIVGVVLLLAAVGGWLFWQDKQKQAAAADSEALAQVYTDIGVGKLATVPQRLDRLAKDGTDAVRASALFTRAAVAIEQNDRPLAIAKYNEAANDKGLPTPYRNLGLIRATTLEFDSLKPDQVIARMAPIAKPGNPWFGSAGELTAMALIKQGKTLEAGRLFAAVSADKQVPESIRARAVQIAGSLGVDASASFPAPAQ